VILRLRWSLLVRNTSCQSRSSLNTVEEISASAEEMLSSTEEVSGIASKLNESVNDLISKVEGFKVQ
jgi:methyl-accepting chemotaxis protein